MSNERRAAPRFAVEIEATVTSKDKVLPARTQDLSRSGICVRVDEAVPAGATITIEVALKFSENAFSFKNSADDG